MADGGARNDEVPAMRRLTTDAEPVPMLGNHVIDSVTSASLAKPYALSWLSVLASPNISSIDLNALST
jgi:hypothetical protein